MEQLVGMPKVKQEKSEKSQPNAQISECDIPVPGIPVPGNSRFREFFNFFDGIGTGIEKIWYRKKSRNLSRKKLVSKNVTEPVSEKLGSEKVSESVSKKFGTEKNIGTSLEIFRIICVDLGPGLVPVSSRSRDFCTFLDGTGTSLEKIWYRKKSRNRSRKILVPKKVSESVSKKFGTEKKSRNRYRSDFGSRHTLMVI